MGKKDTQAPGPLLKDANYDPESKDLRNVLSQCHLKLSDFFINNMQNKLFFITVENFFQFCVFFVSVIF